MKLRTIGIALCAGALAGCAAKKTAPPPEPVAAPRAATPPAALPSGSIGEGTVTAIATVQSVDLKTRHVTLKDSEGKKVTIVAGPEVRNLAQVKKGDVLRITYHESIAYQVSKAGQAKPGVAASTDVSRAPLGEKPAGSVTDTVTVRVTIAAIDRAAPTVTLRDPEGNLTLVKVRDPRKLDSVQIGDIVDITYTEALAIAVEDAGRK
jgi:ribosomal 50S subunit-recycling heat shock protein